MLGSAVPSTNFLWTSLKPIFNTHLLSLTCDLQMYTDTVYVFPHMSESIIQRHFSVIFLTFLPIVNNLTGLNFGRCCAFHLQAWLGSRLASKGGAGLPRTWAQCSLPPTCSQHTEGHRAADETGWAGGIMILHSLTIVNQLSHFFNFIIILVIPTSEESYPYSNPYKFPLHLKNLINKYTHTKEVYI